MYITGKEKLTLPAREEVRVVLESDGTEVDEEDYFTFLPYNTTMMILRQGEHWRPPGAGNSLFLFPLIHPFRFRCIGLDKQKFSA